MMHEVDPELINPTVINRTEFIYKGRLLTSEEVKELFEDEHQTELDVRIRNMDKREMITVCCAAIRKYPLAYIQVIAEYIMELTRKGRKRHENSQHL
jgi:hypothetical protein